MSATLEAIRQKHQLPALATVVVVDGDIRSRAAVGVRKLGDSTAVTTNDLFHIGSCTKSMTATLAAMLVADGKLKWTSTVAEVFPEWKGKIDSGYEAVTLQQLVTHHAGLPGSPPSAAWARAFRKQGTPLEQRREFLQAVLKDKPAAPPGEKAIYSNQGFALAGAMLEKVAGEPWERLITERLFQPLGMRSAGFGPPGTLGQVDAPWGHVGQGARAVPSQQDNPPSIAPAGTVHCSLDDLAKFVQFHLRRGRGTTLLSEDSIKLLHTPVPGGEFACGWMVVERGWAGGKALTHSGSNTMWYVVMWLAPARNFAVIAATNIGGDSAARGCDEVAATMIRQWLPR